MPITTPAETMAAIEKALSLGQHSYSQGILGTRENWAADSATVNMEMVAIDVHKYHFGLLHQAVDEDETGNIPDDTKQFLHRYLDQISTEFLALWDEAAGSNIKTEVGFALRKQIKLTRENGTQIVDAASADIAAAQPLESIEA